MTGVKIKGEYCSEKDLPSSRRLPRLFKRYMLGLNQHQLLLLITFTDYDGLGYAVSAHYYVSLVSYLCNGEYQRDWRLPVVPPQVLTGTGY